MTGITSFLDMAQHIGYNHRLVITELIRQLYICIKPGKTLNNNHYCCQIKPSLKTLYTTFFHSYAVGRFDELHEKVRSNNLCN